MVWGNSELLGCSSEREGGKGIGNMAATAWKRLPKGWPRIGKAIKKRKRGFLGQQLGLGLFLVFFKDFIFFGGFRAS